MVTVFEVTPPMEIVSGHGATRGHAGRHQGVDLV
jgi:hypothetical protein